MKKRAKLRKTAGFLPELQVDGDAILKDEKGWGVLPSFTRQGLLTPCTLDFTSPPMGIFIAKRIKELLMTKSTAYI